MTDRDDKNKNFWSILNIFIKWRRVLLFNFIITVIVMFVIASFMPKYYQSRASLFPPEKDAGTIGLASSILGGGLGAMLSGSGMSLPTFATLSDVYASVLKSRIVAEAVIDDNNLQEIYKLESREKTILQLHSTLNIVVETDGIIRIGFEDKDPERAAKIVNSFIDELNRINQQVRSSKAKATREFIEERLEQTKIDLTEAENNFKGFQEEHKAISLENQVSALIGNLAELKSQLVMAEIELGVFKQTLQPAHTEVKQKQAQIAEIKKQIAKIETGTPGIKDDVLSIPFSEAPDLSLQLIRLTRDLKIQEAIFELLTQQYEQAKISEKRDTPTIQVLDPPMVPERKSRPKRLTMSVLAGILAVILTIIVVIIKEFIDRQKEAQTETYRQMENLLDYLKTDFYAFRSLFASRKGSSDDKNG